MTKKTIKCTKSQCTDSHTQSHIIPQCIEEDEDEDEDIVISPPSSSPSHRFQLYIYAEVIYQSTHTHNSVDLTRHTKRHIIPYKKPKW